MRLFSTRIAWILLPLTVLIFSCTNKNLNKEKAKDCYTAIDSTGLKTDKEYSNGNYTIAKDEYKAYLDTTKSCTKLRIAKITRNLGVCYAKLGKINRAKRTFRIALKLFDSTNCEFGKAKTYSNLNVIFCRLNKLEKAFENGFKALEAINKYETQETSTPNKPKEFYKIKCGILINLGITYKYQQDNNLALMYYKEALNIANQTKNRKQLIVLYHNIANLMLTNTFKTKKHISKALDYYRKELKYAKEDCDCLHMAYAYYSISNIYRKKIYEHHSIDTSKMYLDYALKILKDNYIYDLQSKKRNVDLILYSGIVRAYANYYFAEKDFNTSFQYAKLAIKISKESHDISAISNSYSTFAEVLNKLGKSKKAYKFAYLNLKLREKQMNDKTAIFFNKLEQERTINRNKILENQNQLQKKQIRTKNILLLSLITVSAIVILGLVMFLRYRIKYAQRIKKLNNKLLTKNKNISDSIVYAKRIQQAILPTQTKIDNLFPENFILHQPKDVISGDFYWATEIDNLKIIVAADCTGHGVPGALLSMLGISYLNEIVQKRKITQANEILNELRNQIINSFKQSASSEHTKDGIDAAICIIDYRKGIVQYAGANNPIYLITQNNTKTKLNVIKPDRMPIGKYDDTIKPFTNNIIEISKGDNIYMLTDGYKDQFGGTENKKYKSRRLKNLLLSIYKFPMNKQKEILNIEFKNWMGRNEQVDDVLAVGIKI